MELPNPASATPFLRIAKLTKMYSDTFAVRDLSLLVRKGEFVSLLGPSGCGKSTTLGMIAGFVKPSSGTIELEGNDLTRLPANKRGLGVVFQNYALFPHMTAGHNVAFGLEMRKIPPAEIKRRVDGVLDLVGLSAFAGRMPAAMSGGQQQRVALARALVINPPLLLLDEPLSNLDAKRREEMQSELRRIQRTLGTTTIMVTHDQTEALALSDRIAVMRDGCIDDLGDPQGVYNTPKTEFAAQFLGRATILTIGGEESNPRKIVLRPERVSFVPAEEGRIIGIVESATFHGNCWLYEVRSDRGVIGVECRNESRDAPSIGARVGLAWRDDETHHLGAEQ